MKQTTDLLDFEFVFSQQVPLTVDKFVRAFRERVLEDRAQLRGWEQLEELHRVGALVPLFRFPKNTRYLLRRAREEKQPATSMYLGLNTHFTMGLTGDEQVGTLTDPKTETYKSWYSFIRSYDKTYLHSSRRDDQEKTGKFWASSFLFSPYQLLLIPKLRTLIPHMRRQRRRTSQSYNYRYRLNLKEKQQAKVQQWANENRELAMILTALEPRYLPRLRGHRHSEIYSGTEHLIEELIAYHQELEPIKLLDRIGWEADTVKDVSEKLLREADRLDPLRNWYDLVRMSHPDMLNQLRGNALVALDHRRAAEMLLLFYEELQVEGAAPPFEELPMRIRGPRETRLKHDYTKLDVVLMKYGLSPQPSLVLIVEGKVEEEIIPRAMELLGIPQDSSFIHIFNSRGIDKDFELLARFVGPVQLSEPLGDTVELSRPPTHFLVAVDAESKFKDSNKHANIQANWIAGIHESLPPDYQTKITKDELELFVHIETWGDVFEFAHFTDAELADALLQIHNGSESPSLDYLIQRVKEMRRPGANKNIEKILYNWTYRQEQEDPNYQPSRQIGKIEIARGLWPILEKRIQDADDSIEQLNEIPLVRVLLKAQRLASLSHRKDVVIRF